VKRGNIEGSLEQGLFEQAKIAGVKIEFGKTIPRLEADIVATGPDLKKTMAAAKGIVFETSSPDVAISVVDNDLAYLGYSYLLITEGHGCICAVLFDDFNRINSCFKETKAYFERMADIEIKNPRDFGGVGSFSPNGPFKEGKSLLVGEAAGLQDLLAGFGMRTAFKSGYLAARAIIEGTDYEELAKRELAII
jgi:flavin-dependent dehydrogenase